MSPTLVSMEEIAWKATAPTHVNAPLDSPAPTVLRVSFILQTSFVAILYSFSSPFLYFPFIWGCRCVIMKLKYNITNNYFCDVN